MRTQRIVCHQLRRDLIRQCRRKAAPDIDAGQFALLGFGIGREFAAFARQIGGITQVSARRVFRFLGSVLRSGIVRGLEIELEFDESQYVGSGAFLFASVIERFFALYASINSFTELVMRTRQREGIVKRWPPRAAEQIVL